MADRGKDEDDGNARSRRVATTSTPERCPCGPATSSSSSATSSGPTIRSRIGFDPGLPMTSGNTNYGRQMMLWGRHGYHIAIMPAGRVKGTDDEYNKFAMLEFTSAGVVGEVKIRGMETNLYLAMNKDGKLYGEADANSDSTVFVEAFLTQYNTYLSRKWAHLGWYVALKKDGKPKPGPKTKWGQKAIQFLPRRRV